MQPLLPMAGAAGLGEGLWITPQPVPPWEWRKGKSREGAGLCLGVGALELSLRRPQRDANGRAE